MLSGHQDYVHSVSMKNNGQECVSASEDGSVRIWGNYRSHIGRRFGNKYKILSRLRLPSVCAFVQS